MTIPHGALERDLCDHFSRKIHQAFSDMVALTSTSGQALLLAYTAVATSAAQAGAAFAVHHGHAKADVDPFDVAIAILQASKEAKDDPNSALAGARNVLADAAAFRALQASSPSAV